MRHLHGAFEQTIFCQVARELQLFANGKRRSGPHANSRLTQVNHGAGDCPPASLELAVPLDDQPDGLPLVAHALTLLSLTKLSRAGAVAVAGPRTSWGSEQGAMARIDGVAPGALPHHNADRRGLEPVTGVPRLRAVRDGRERVHLGAEVDVVTRPRQPLHDRHRAVGMNGHVHEPVDVGDDVLLAEPERREGPQEVAAAVGRILDAVAKLVAFRATAPADRVVTAAGILHDREEPPPHVRVDAVAPGAED